MRRGPDAGSGGSWRDAVSPAVMVTVTDCGVPPVSWVDGGLNEQLTSIEPLHASVTLSAKPVLAVRLAVTVPLALRASESEEALSVPPKLTMLTGNVKVCVFPSKVAVTVS